MERRGEKQYIWNCLLVLVAGVTLCGAQRTWGRGSHVTFYRTQPEELYCDKMTSPTTATTHGIGILRHSFNPLMPHDPIGDPVLEIEMEKSTDCSALVPKGYILQRTRTANAGVQTRQCSTLSAVTTGRSSEARASIGLSLGSFGSSVEAELSKASSERYSASTQMSYFVTSLETVDVVVSKVNSFNVTLTPSFVGRLRHLGSMGDSLKGEQKAVWLLLEQYPCYLHSATLGSRIQEVRTVGKPVVDRAREVMTSAEIHARFTNDFVSASSGISASVIESLMEEGLNVHYTATRTVIGAKPNFDTLTFPRATEPGLLEADFRPICDILPDESHTQKLKNNCRSYVEDTRSCFPHLPRIAKLKPTNQEELKAILVATRMNEKCSAIPPPIFNMKISVYAKGIFFSNESKNVNECAFAMIRLGAAVFSYVNDKCFLCFDGQEAFDRNADYRRGHCQEAAKNLVFGVGFRPTWDRAKRKCNLNRHWAKIRTTEMGCYDLVRCDVTWGEICVTVLRKLPKRDIITKLEHEVRPALFLPASALAFGDVLAVRNFSVEYSCSETEEERKGWYELMWKGRYHTEDAIEKINRQVSKYLRDFGMKSCVEWCMTVPHCDMVRYIHHPRLSGLGLKPDGNGDIDYMANKPKTPIHLCSSIDWERRPAPLRDFFSDNDHLPFTCIAHEKRSFFYFKTMFDELGRVVLKLNRPKRQVVIFV